MSSRKPDILNQDNTPPDQMSAWERWELPSMSGDTPAKGNAFNLRTSAGAAADHAQFHAPVVPELKPLTADEVEAIRLAAYEEGLQEGREAGRAEGYQAGYSSGESDVKASITRVSQICRALLEPIPQQDEDLEQAVLEMVEKICKRIVHRELILDSSGVLAVVREALDCLNAGAQRIRIHLNAADAEFVTRHLREAGELEDSWRLLAHPTITPGGCIVESDVSMIDARVEKRLASVLHQVFSRQKAALEQRSSQQGNVDQLLDEVDTFAIDDDATFPEPPAE